MIKPIEAFQGISLTFNVTTECNLRCDYCYEANKEPGRLPLGYARKFIDLMLTAEDPLKVIGTKNEFIIRQGAVLDFIGGDALSVPDLCGSILEYFIFKSVVLGHRWADKWRASISTNGTLFDEPGVKDFLYKYQHNMSLGVSVDGCPEVHNRNRNNSLEKILKNWDWYVSYCSGGGAAPSTKATCNKHSIPFLKKSIKFLHEDLGLNHINMNFIGSDMGLDESDYTILDKQLEESVEYILDHCDDLYITLLDKSMTIGKPMEDPDKGWCGSGYMPCLSIDGKIYSCFRFLPLSLEKKDLDDPIGNIWDGFVYLDNLRKVQGATRGVVSDERCLGCPIETMCAWCIADSYSKTGDLRRGVTSCMVNQLRDKWARVYWNEYNKIKNIPERYENRDLTALQ